MKKIIAIGGGEIRRKTTAEIDAYIAGLAKKHAGLCRANALFFGTASHDSMPYFNSFRKTYTSDFDIKSEVALTVYGEMNIDKIKTKIENADAIYVGGGDTLYMLEKWEEYGVTPLIKQAYENGVIIAGLSAGAICWFEGMYTDSDIMRGGAEYRFEKGLGLIKGLCTPHFNERADDFIKAFAQSSFKEAYAIENDGAIEFTDGSVTHAIGAAYKIKNDGGAITKVKL